jgi:hypothetical protein
VEIVTHSPHFGQEVAFPATYAEVAAAIAKEPDEWFYVLGGRRDQVILILRGTEGEVTFPTGVRRSLRGKVTVQNHPLSADTLSSFSIEDIVGALQRQEKMMVVVDSEGRSLHTFSPPRMTAKDARSLAKRLYQDYDAFMSDPRKVRWLEEDKHVGALEYLQQKYHLDLRLFIPFQR